MANIEPGTDIINVEDLTTRVEELEDEIAQAEEDLEDVPEEDSETPCRMEQTEELVELEREKRELEEFLEELEGSGGDHKWRGSWYPAFLILDDHFEDYAQEFAEDIGAINRDASWPNNCIDWEK